MALPNGPRLPALIQTLFWIRRPIPFMRACRARFGPLFTARLKGVGEVVFLSDPGAIREVFTHDAADLEAGSVNVILRPVVGDASILLLDGAEHLRHRKLLLPPFHGERMRGYAATMREITERVTDEWRPNSTVVLRTAMQRITLDVILRVVFGFERGPDFEACRESFEHLLANADSGYARLALMISLQRDIPGTPWRRFLRDRARVDEIVYAQIAQRRGDAARGVRHDDVLDLLLDARDEAGAPLTDRELRDELVTLLVAGHETTATALCWMFERLLAHPDAEARVRDELDRAQATPDGGAASSGGAAPGDGGDPLARLEYLDATIKESLRCRPILPLVGRRVQRPLRIGGYDVPIGAVVAPCVYLMHHDPDVYPDPEAFRPERFLERRADPYTWLPFGGGVRRCLGMAFALYEMKVVSSSLLSRFVFARTDARPARTVRRTITFAPKGGIKTVVSRRPVAGVLPPPLLGASSLAARAG